MIFKYGSYAHSDNEVMPVSLSKRPVYTTRGFRFGTQERWELEGVIQAATVGALTTALDALQDAYDTPGQDAILYESDGSTTTHHQMVNSDFLGGVRPMGISFPDGSGAEYTTYRRYRISLEGIRADSESTIMEYEESITTVGSGGPRLVALETLNTEPVLQLTALQTMQTIIQSGRAVSYSDWVIPGPLLPSLEQGHLRQINRRSPRAHRGTFAEYQIDWQFVFVSPTPLLVYPTSV